MKRFFLFLFLSSAVFADINPKDLSKVTPDFKGKCVEYFSYKNAMYCSLKPLSKEPIDPHIKDYEYQTIAFDGRPWQAVWGKKTDEITSVEYVPAGDDINNWYELVTSQFIADPQNTIALKAFVDEFFRGIKEQGFSPKVIMYQDTPNQILLEFQLSEPKNMVQDELQIIKRGPGGIYILHYTIKKADMGDAKRNQWKQILQAAKYQKV